MSNRPKTTPVIYPAYTFTTSPTYFKWVKLTATGIQALTKQPGFEGQNLYFHTNHPIQFVCLTAPVVAIDSPFPKYIFLTLDDGSGSTIEVKITRLPMNNSAAEHTQQHHNPSGTVQWSPLTKVSNVTVTGSPLGGVLDLSIDNTPVTIGTIITAKGTISEFRGIKQIDLKRVTVVKTTNEEVTEWRKCAEWYRDVLARPWYLSRKKLAALKEEDEERVSKVEQRREEDCLKRRKGEDGDQRRVEERRREYREKKERLRRQEEVIMDKGALV